MRKFFFHWFFDDHFLRWDKSVIARGTFFWSVIEMKEIVIIYMRCGDCENGFGRRNDFW
jgi:hypothetical protein